MSIPPKKPSGPFKRGPDGRPERKGSPDGSTRNQEGGSELSEADFKSRNLGNYYTGDKRTTIHPMPKPDGYDSSNDLEDPPKNYYEILSRERDRKNIKNARERKKNRDLAAAGWPQDHPVHPLTFVRGQGHQFKQEGSYCKAACAAFIQLRFFGANVGEALSALHGLNSRWFTQALSLWQGTYTVLSLGKDSSIHAKEAQGTTALHAYITKWIATNESLISDVPLISTPSCLINRSDTQAASSPKNWNYQFSEHMIGQFVPDGTNLALDWGDISNKLSHGSGSGSLSIRPHVPPSSQASRTFQEALFGALQPSKKQDMTLANWGNADAKPATMMRYATPFVVLRITFWNRSANRFTSHQVLVDFSDPKLPGIFDPNFGWMEPVQGFCILTLEKALTSIWQHYSGQEMKMDTTPNLAGRSRLSDTLPEDKIFKGQGAGIYRTSMTSYQIYSLATPVPASKKPPLKW